MLRNALKIPYSWLVRPRFVVYAWIIVEVFVWRGSMDVVLAICAALLATKTLTGFAKLRRVI